jgi:hypothetical protein
MYFPDRASINFPDHIRRLHRLRINICVDELSHQCAHVFVGIGHKDFV